VSGYISIWNESDADFRREGIIALWSGDGVCVGPSTEDHGYSAIEASIANAHDKLVAKGFLLVPADTTDSHHDIIRIDWKILSTASQEINATGSDFLVLRDDRRIFSAYRFVNAAAKS
jgi:hypothetical protein